MYRLILNGKMILEGSSKELLTIFECLSGLSFGRGSRSSGLSKMTAVDAYHNYLYIKGKELLVSEWEGELILVDIDNKPVKVHLFDTHSALRDASQINDQRKKSAK